MAGILGLLLLWYPLSFHTLFPCCLIFNWNNLCPGPGATCLSCICAAWGLTGFLSMTWGLGAVLKHSCWIQTLLFALPSLRSASLCCQQGCCLTVTKLPWDASEKTVLSDCNPLESAGDGGCCYSPHMVTSSSPAPAVQALETTDSYLTFSARTWWL